MTLIKLHRVFVSITLLVLILCTVIPSVFAWKTSSVSSVTTTPSSSTSSQSQTQLMSLNSNNNNSETNNNKEDDDDGGGNGGTSSSSSSVSSVVGRLEQLKQREAELSRLLTAIRQDKLEVLRKRPLTIGIVGFGRFGQFIARTFAKHGRVVVTSRSDYTDIAQGMGVTYVPGLDIGQFLNENLDVIVIAVSIVSFEDTVTSLAPYLTARSQQQQCQPLIVDVLSVKEHPRNILLQYLPKECDIMCTHPMFGPDSGKNGWHGLNLVYERTRIDGIVLDPTKGCNHYSPSGSTKRKTYSASSSYSDDSSFVVDVEGSSHSIHEQSEAHIEGMDRMERFLSIWEEEGCRMVPLSCVEHDEYAANSQFITHLMGRILGTQGLSPTPIDTKGFESVLKLVGTTTADSFDLFYGLYKYNPNSMDTIKKLRSAMDDVVENLKAMEKTDK